MICVVVLHQCILVILRWGSCVARRAKLGKLRPYADVELRTAVEVLQSSDFSIFRRARNVHIQRTYIQVVPHRTAFKSINNSPLYTFEVRITEAGVPRYEGRQL